MSFFRWWSCHALEVHGCSKQNVPPYSRTISQISMAKLKRSLASTILLSNSLCFWGSGSLWCWFMFCINDMRVHGGETQTKPGFWVLIYLRIVLLVPSCLMSCPSSKSKAWPCCNPNFLVLGPNRLGLYTSATALAWLFWTPSRLASRLIFLGPHLARSSGSMVQRKFSRYSPDAGLGILKQVIISTHCSWAEVRAALACRSTLRLLLFPKLSKSSSGAATVSLSCRPCGPSRYPRSPKPRTPGFVGPVLVSIGFPVTCARYGRSTCPASSAASPVPSRCPSRSSARPGSPCSPCTSRQSWGRWCPVGKCWGVDRGSSWM